MHTSVPRLLHHSAWLASSSHALHLTATVGIVFSRKAAASDATYGKKVPLRAVLGAYYKDH